MSDQVGISLRLTCFVRRDEATWVSGCPALDVFSQGRSKEAAKLCLQEAVELWVDSCVERNVLPAALLELGFTIPSATGSAPTVALEAKPRTASGAATEPGGEPFSLEITVPAYQSSLHLAGESVAR